MTLPPSRRPSCERAYARQRKVPTVPRAAECTRPAPYESDGGDPDRPARSSTARSLFIAVRRQPERLERLLGLVFVDLRSRSPRRIGTARRIDPPRAIPG